MEVSETTQPKKKRLIIRKKVSTKPKLVKKKRLEKRVSKKVKPIEQAYLEFDTDIDPKFIPSIPEKIEVDMDLINGLPKIEFKETVINNICEDDDDDDSQLLKEESEELDIDVESLEELNIGNKNYFMDENKGIIYDSKYNVIGNIDEFGNPNISV
tara:strand:- start:1599 stop:2066 length:468 start_codon:yes stop_codon:yes gene_type:complete